MFLIIFIPHEWLSAWGNTCHNVQMHTAIIYSWLQDNLLFGGARLQPVLTALSTVLNSISLVYRLCCVLVCDKGCLLYYLIRTTHMDSALTGSGIYCLYPPGKLYSSSRDNEAHNSMVSNCIYTPVCFVPVKTVVTCLTCIGFVPVLKQPGPFPKSIMRYYNKGCNKQRKSVSGQVSGT